MNTVLQSAPPFSDTLTSARIDEPGVGFGGRWEGNIGKGVLVLELRSDGTASINLKRRVRTVYHPCTWDVVGDNNQIICIQSPPVTFRIISISENVIVLSLGDSPRDTCLLHRTPKPVIRRHD